MTKPGRIPCINPDCRCTAPIERHPNSAEIVCYKCWKKTPKALRDHYSDAWKRYRKLYKLAERRVAKGEPGERFNPLFDRICTEIEENWAKIHAYWASPVPESPPEGIDDFLKEVGLA